MATTTTTETSNIKLPLKSPQRVLSPALKERRPSLAATSSPRIVDASAYSFRDDTSIMHPPPPPPHPHPPVNPVKSRLTKMQPPPVPTTKSDEDSHQPSSSSPLAPASPDKRHRKKWTEEETQMLVNGCNIHGVGNWKTILADPTLKFDDRSAVDLKDRFRTYFPDAYRQYYPNAKTHLSSRVRATNPDGTSMFAKTRSKKRRPFTEEEDRALLEGYKKMGCMWAQIVKSPIFEATHRRSTDLRDRFRNAFPEEYERAGYKPRGGTKKKARGSSLAGSSTTPGSPVPQHTELGSSDLPTQPIHATAIDDAILSSSNPSGAGPVRRRRRAYTGQGVQVLRGGTRSVPQSAAATDNESDEEEELRSRCARSPPASKLSSPGLKDDRSLNPSLERDATAREPMTQNVPSLLVVVPSSSSEASIPPLSPIHTQPVPWTTLSGVDTPTHSAHQAWATGSPTSPSSLLPPFQTQSPFLPSTMIGKSAWGTNDWFSPNPRLDSAASSISSASASSHSYGVQPLGEVSPPSSCVSPNSLSVSLGGGPSDYGSGGGGGGYGVMDRYGLVPPQHNTFFHNAANPHALLEYTSDIGVGDSFSDSDFNSVNENGGGMRGFTHHSNYAGDLMVGARTHQPVQMFNGIHNSFAPGLGLNIPLGVDNPNNIGLTTPSLVPLPTDDTEFAGISLEDSFQRQEDAEMVDITGSSADLADSPPLDHGQSDALSFRVSRRRGSSASKASPDCLDLDELVTLPQDDNEQMHATPPGTPHQSPQLGMNTLRGMRHTSLTLAQFSGSSSMGQARSISVPPSEARNSVSMRSHSTVGVSASQPDFMNGTAAPMDRRPSVFGGQPFGMSATNPIAPPTNTTLNHSSPQETSDSPHEIPFLDLHYSWNNNGQMPDVNQQYHHIQGQALDLAGTTHQSFSSAGAQLAAPVFPPPPAWQFPPVSSSMTAPPHQQEAPPTRSTTPVQGNSSNARTLNQQPATARPYTMHSRGQSQSAISMPSAISIARSVNPRDLMLPSGGETVGMGKGKRASWDGRA